MTVLINSVDLKKVRYSPLYRPTQAMQPRTIAKIIQGVRSNKILMLSSTMELSIVDFMNNEEPNKIPVSEPAPQPVVEPAGTWVPQKEYQEFKNQQVTEVAREHRQGIKIRIFYILLAVGGFLVAVAFIGNFISPIEASEMGARCTRKVFEAAQFWLNFIGYPLLLEHTLKILEVIKLPKKRGISSSV